jgi:hypothetical protein
MFAMDVVQTVQAPVMPLRLLKFMNQGDVDNPVAGSCQGGGGKRRVAGVLASLLYLHLVVLCNEWHAEITQSELLESMGQRDAPNEVKAVTKKRKKKKGYPSRCSDLCLLRRQARPDRQIHQTQMKLP